jgi:lipopolysaccharide export LptBFGC system permease protein LptF
MDFEYDTKTIYWALLDWAATSIMVGSILTLFLIGLSVVYLTFVLKETANQYNLIVYCWLVSVGFSFITNFLIMAKEREWIRF